MANTNQTEMKILEYNNGSQRLFLEGTGLIEKIANDLYSIPSGEFYFDGRNVKETGRVTHTQFGKGYDKIKINGRYRSIDRLFESVEKVEVNN